MEQSRFVVLRDVELVQNFSPHMEPEGSSLCSQEPSLYPIFGQLNTASGNINNI
jgi:hypothetical protein